MSVRESNPSRDVALIYTVHGSLQSFSNKHKPSSLHIAPTELALAQAHTNLPLASVLFLIAQQPHPRTSPLRAIIHTETASFQTAAMASQSTQQLPFQSSQAQAQQTQLATFAAGCFWSVELAYQRVPGVVRTAVGYTQGSTESPTYEAVCGGRTGHVEAVQLEYDPSQVSYETLLDVFWHKHDPTQRNRQGGDYGSQYRSGIYYHSPEQEALARASFGALQAKNPKQIQTEIFPAKRFWRAEEDHQQYLAKGVSGRKQSIDKGCNDPIRCYG